MSLPAWAKMPLSGAMKPTLTVSAAAATPAPARIPRPTTSPTSGARKPAAVRSAIEGSPGLRAALADEPGKTIGRERQLVDGDAKRRERIGHRVGDGGARARAPTLADSLDTQGVERRRRFLEDLHDRALGHLHRGRNQIVHERRRERLALLVVHQLLEQRAAQPLGESANDLPAHDHRIDRPAHVVGHDVLAEDDTAG